MDPGTNGLAGRDRLSAGNPLTAGVIATASQYSTTTLARHRQADRPTIALVLSNLATILFAVVQQWDVSVVIWIYRGQSIIIGYFNVRRMLADKREYPHCCPT
jgi:hypothetical protein